MVKPHLFVPPVLAHQFADLFLSIYSATAGNPSPSKWHSLRWKNLYFPNPLAPAGGVDKSAKHLKAWWALGAGFIEVGTVTPLPQKKNPGPSLKRNNKEQALWNYLGFPGEGLEKVRERLKKLQNRPTPVFANIGKNRATDNDKAEEDYLKCISSLHPFVDAFVVNISSPNTKGLGELARPKRLKRLLQAISEKLHSTEGEKKPFFIKWSPDLKENEFSECLDTALECGAEGHIICNTTTDRKENSAFPAYGGVSGAPLADISKKRLKWTQKHLGAERKNQLIISVGGILKPKDVFERLDMGADLVQSYSALVFQGPLFLRKVFRFQVKNKKPDKKNPSENP